MIPITNLIEGLTGAVELAKRSKEFFNQFESRKRRIFINHIEPTFEALRPVIRSYGDDIAAFRVAISDSPSYAAAEKSIVELSGKRRRTARDRGELITTLAATLDYWYTKVGRKPEREPLLIYARFILSLFLYFNLYHELRVGGPSRATELAGIAQRIVIDLRPSNDVEQTERWPTARDGLLSHCDRVLRALERRHLSLYRHYADLRLVCLGAGGPQKP
jgi:hypothetical protein